MGRSDTTAPGFLRWDLTGDYVDSPKRAATRTFTNSITDADGYTALEEYLNWLAGPHARCVRNSYLVISAATAEAG